MPRAQQITLIALFLGVIYAVPTIQAVLDSEDDELPQALELFDDWPTEKHLREFETAMEDNSFLEETARPVYQVAAYWALGDLGAKALQGRDGWYFYHPGVKYLTERYYRDIPNLELEGSDPVEVIVDFKEQLEARGIRLLLVPVPGKASVYPDKLAWVAPGSRVHANTSRFADELGSRGVEVFDLHTPLLDARTAGKQLYMKDDTHWTGHGILVAAAVLAERIRREPWYQEPEQPRFHRSALPVVRRGDIPAMTRIPLQEELFDDENVDCFRVSLIESGEAYQDDPASPVLWLGDSFSRVFQTDEPEAAGIIANLAYELQTPLDSIVNDGGASTLVRQQLARAAESLLKGKKLVVWEFVERDIRFGMRGWQEIELFPEDG